MSLVNKFKTTYQYEVILESEVKWALGNTTMRKASGGDGIPAELFQVLKDNAVKVLHLICQQIWKTQQWPQHWKRLVFIPIPKKGNAKDCSNYHTIALISHSSKMKESENCSVMPKDLQPCGLCSPWNSPSQSTWVGKPFPSLEAFPTQGLNPGLPYCRCILYQVNHKGSPHARKVMLNIL